MKKSGGKKAKVAVVEYGTPELQGLPEAALHVIYDQLDAEDVCAMAGTCRRIRNAFMKEGERDVWKKLFLELEDVDDEPYFDDKNQPTRPTDWHMVYDDVVAQSRKEWKPSQIFGEDPSSASSDDHNITSISFSPDGGLLAVGYQSGQVVIFQNTANDTYKFYTQFESHTPEFDFMTSTEIEERIADLTWVPHTFRNNSRMMLTTNDRTVKLYKMGEKKKKKMKAQFHVLPKVAPSSSESDTESSSDSDDDGSVVGVTAKRVYKNAHAYNVNSLSCSADGAHFLSCDDLRINLWNLEVSDTCFTVVDRKPKNISDLDEVVTVSRFHPHDSSLFAYGCSNGKVHLGDLRLRSTCDVASKTFRANPVSGKNLDFFSEVVSSVSDVEFAADGRYMYARDYLNVHVFDLTMDREPILSYPVHDHLIPQLPELYDNECMFDKFQICASSNGMRIVTGSYSNSFHVYDATTGSAMTRMVNNPRIKGQPKGTEFKMRRMSYHSGKDVLAMSGGSYIYLYHKISKP